MRRRRALPWLALALIASGCIIQNRVLSRADSQPTGTCEGACDHYLACKGDGTPAARNACVTECREIFDDPFTLFHFETLECSEAVAFVEGTSGRGPGAPVNAGRQALPTSTSSTSKR